MLPDHVIAKLKQNGSFIVEEHEDLSILFCNVVGFKVKRLRSDADLRCLALTCLALTVDRSFIADDGVGADAEPDVQRIW